MPIEVTEQVSVGEIDGEHLPLLKCVCGKKYESWDAVMSIYEFQDPWQCSECGRQLFFRFKVTVWQVTT